MINALFGSLLALLDIVFFIFAVSLLAFAIIFGLFAFYTIRAFIRSERKQRHQVG